MKKTTTAAILAVAIFLCSTAFASGLLDSLTTSGMRTAPVFNEVCYIPYNIDTYGFQTGIHIVPDYRDGLTNFFVAFFNGPDVYAMREIAIGPEGWSGIASALLPAGHILQTPSFILIVTTGTGNGKFWATQFIFTGDGFSHITVESERVQ